MDMPKSRTLGDFLDELAERYPNKEAVIYKDQRYTYRDFQNEANRIAKSLIKLGLKRDDKVASVVNNRLEWVTMAFGVVKAGCVFVPLNTFYRTGEIEYAIKHCEVKLLVTIDKLLKSDYLAMIKELLPALDQADPGEAAFEGFPDLKYVVSLGKQARGTYSWEDFLNIGR
ncbi:MAG: AMP-binding protein, partial [Pseudomonadota bacterium]